MKKPSNHEEACCSRMTCAQLIQLSCKECQPAHSNIDWELPASHLDMGVGTDDSSLAMNGFPTSIGSPMRPITASPLMVKLQNSDSDPAFWFSEDMVGTGGLADIFKDDPATLQ